MYWETARHLNRVAGADAALVFIDEAQEHLGRSLELASGARTSAELAALAGNLLHDLGEWETAQQQYEWAAQLLESATEEGSLRSRVHNDLALVLQDRGDLAGARRELLRSLALSTDPHSLGHGRLLGNLGSVGTDLAMTYLHTPTADNLRAGETLRLANDHFAQSLQIFRELMPDAAEDLLTSLLGSARVAEALGDEEAWREAASEASRLIGTAELGPGAFWQVAVLNARLARRDGFPDVAIDVLATAWNQVLPDGPRPAHLSGLELIADLVGRQGVDSRLTDVLSNIVAIEDDALATLLGRGSERETVAAFGGYARRLRALLGLLLHDDADEVDPSVYEILLNRKGLLAERRGRLWLRSHEAPEVAEQAAEVRRLRAEVTRVDIDGADHASVQQARRRREQLALQLDRAEAQLARELAGAEPAFEHHEYWEIVAALALDELFIDLVQVVTPDAGLQYAAFVIGDGELPRVVRLGGVALIDEALGKLTTAPSLAAAAALAAAVPGLAGLFADLTKRRIIVAPTGAWGTTPLALLLGPDGAPLIERFTVTSVPSARWLIAHRLHPTASGSPGPPVVIGDPDFDLDTLADGAFVPRWRVDRLRHARREAQQVARVLGVRPVLDRAATRERLLAVRRPRILHVASHGTFLDARNSRRELSEPTEYRLRHENGTVVMEETDQLGWGSGDAPDPSDQAARHAARLEWLRDIGPAGSGARSAILLAGFNAWLAGADDPAFGTGLVTAGEFAILDLSGTGLVVLSACETGVGAEEHADGSQIGLRADALAAGAALCVSSLWNVDDKVTADLMERFYRHLTDGVAAAEALRRAQLEIRAITPDPRLWAAWIAEGDDSPRVQPNNTNS